MGPGLLDFGGASVSRFLILCALRLFFFRNAGASAFREVVATFMILQREACALILLTAKLASSTPDTVIFSYFSRRCFKEVGTREMLGNFES